MRTHVMGIFVGVCALAGFWPAAAPAQQPAEVKEKPPMYSYIANWEVPRNKFKDMEDMLGKNAVVMSKSLSSGVLVGFGSDITLVHKEGESTHDVWWSSMSWSGLMKALESIKSSPTSSAPVLDSGKHNDKIYSARYYNWRSGSFTNGYTRLAIWKLKPDAPADAIDQLAKHYAVPMLEKLLAEGAIYEYEIDEEAVHTESPGTFMVIFVGNGPEGLDKASAALAGAQKASPFVISTFSSWVDTASHRDGLYQTSGTYK